jgi:hypothetical protein
LDQQIHVNHWHDNKLQVVRNTRAIQMKAGKII